MLSCQSTAILLHWSKARRYSRLGSHRAALPFAQRWLALDPIHEVVHRRLIELSILAEQPTAALRHYEACVRIPNEELGVAPEEETVELYEAMKQRHIETPTGGQGDASGKSQFSLHPPGSPRPPANLDIHLC
jgi:DNA-binding SARP family transcriptional activator